jgi:pimeloyl-ACP methyl ester carboxylesterase
VATGAHPPVEASAGQPQADVTVETDTPPASVGASLANSARTVVGTVQEDAGFLARPDGSLFVVLHRPADQPPVGLLTVCSSLFAEQHTDYRREVRLARMLASAGLAVARFHYRGFGNSAPTSASLDAFTRDALDVNLAAQRLTSVSRIAFLGVGVGSLVASRALLAHPEAPLLLWKPVVDGERFFRDFFRARLIAATRVGGTRPGTTDELLARLVNEGHVDVMGFTVATSLYDSLIASRLTETLPRHPRRILVQPFRGARATGVERLAEDWRACGCLVDVQPVKLAEDPWFIPDGAAVAASILATEEQLMANARDWLLSSWRNGE